MRFQFECRANVAFARRGRNVAAAVITSDRCTVALRFSLINSTIVGVCTLISAPVSAFCYLLFAQDRSEHDDRSRSSVFVTGEIARLPECIRRQRARP